MCRKLFILASVVLVLALAGNVLAIETIWSGFVDSEWSNTSNWSAGVPDITLDGRIDDAAVPNYLTIHAGDDAHCARLTVRASGICYMTGGYLTMHYGSGRWRVGWRTGDDSFMDVSGGTINTIYTLQIADDLDSKGTLVFNNATATIGRGIDVGDGSGGVATFNMDGGVFNASTIGSYSSQVGRASVLNMSGGTINFNNALSVAGQAFLDGGVINTTEFNVAAGPGQNGSVDIDGGSVYATSASRWADGGGIATVNFYSGYASIADLALGMDSGVGVWNMDGGLYESTGGMRLGTGTGPLSGGSGTINMSAGTIRLNDSTTIGYRNTRRGELYMDPPGGLFEVNATLFIGRDAGSDGAIYLDAGTVYCDDVVMEESSGSSGLIQFGTTNGKLVLGSDKTETVKGYVGDGNITQTVHARAYIETVHDDVNDQTVAYVVMPDLTQAWNPNPADGATIPGLTVTLSWNPGDGATSHDVYFGDNFDDVNNGIGGTSKGNQTGTTYGPISFDTLGKALYWRIDEHHAGGTTKGRVWQFNTPDCVHVDYFDDYADDAALKVVWGPNGALETAVAEDGNSMRLPYIGSSVEASRSPDESNWTAGGIEALTVWYNGDANVAGLYVELESNNGAQSGTLTDAAAINEVAGVVDVNSGEWHQMNFDLDDFGIDLSNVTKIAVGMSPQSGTSGNVYFDTISLYPSRRIGPNPGADLSGDGDVNFVDLANLVAQWLDTNMFP